MPNLLAAKVGVEPSDAEVGAEQGGRAYWRPSLLAADVGVGPSDAESGVEQGGRVCWRPTWVWSNAIPKWAWSRVAEVGGAWKGCGAIIIITLIITIIHNYPSASSSPSSSSSVSRPFVAQVLRRCLARSTCPTKSINIVQRVPHALHVYLM